MGRTVIVVGAGVIGLATAYFLAKAGLSVTVLDQGQPGRGCSYGNMGWVCPSLSEPLPSPGIVKSALKGMVEGTGPLYIKPAELFHIGSWLIRFWRASSPQQYTRGLRANLWLNRHTLELYDQWANDGIAFEMHREGLLYAFRDVDTWHHKREMLSRVADYGFPVPEPVPRDMLMDLEPDLSPDVVGGILLPQERHIRADTLVEGLVQALNALGVELLPATRVDAIETGARAVKAVRTAGGRLRADVYVLATGAWTGALAKSIGIRLPIIAGKGYSLTLVEPNLALHHPLYLGDTKVAVSPYHGALRVGGTMEFSGFNTDIDQKRLNGITRAARQYFRVPPTGRTTEVWAGMRPMTPDGLPVIGRTRQYGNLFIASGHGSDGIFMAPATAALLGNEIQGEPLPPEAHMFHPDRFQ